MNFYTPQTISLPPELIEKPEFFSILSAYMADLVISDTIKIPMPKNHVANAPPHKKLYEKSYNFLTDAEKKYWLKKRTFALFYDVFWTPNGHLIGVGPLIPEILGQLGSLQITYDNGTTQKECSYEIEQVMPRSHRGKLNLKNRPYIQWEILSFLIIHGLNTNDEGKLIFKWQDFSQTIRLQENPFINAEPKLTLTTLFKDTYPEWVKNWCVYYHETHQVSRIILYNNDKQLPETLKQTLEQLTKDYEIELWLVSCDMEFVLGFNSCQNCTLNHSYYWCMQAASYFLNFDLDEYLHNDTNRPLLEYLEKKGKNCPHLFPLFNVPVFEKQNDPNHLHDKHLSEFTEDDFKFRDRQLLYGYPRTIYPPNRILLIYVNHFLYCTKNSFSNYLFFLRINNYTLFTPFIIRDIIIRDILLTIIGKIIGKIKRLSNRFFSTNINTDLLNTDLPDVYVLHYYGLNSNWQLKEGLTRTAPYDPALHVEIKQSDKKSN